MSKTFHSSTPKRAETDAPNITLDQLIAELDNPVSFTVHQLTPRVWKQMFAANPLRSDLHDLAGLRTHANE
jgi:hypothetical protein